MKHKKVIRKVIGCLAIVILVVAVSIVAVLSHMSKESPIEVLKNPSDAAVVSIISASKDDLQQAAQEYLKSHQTDSDSANTSSKLVSDLMSSSDDKTDTDQESSSSDTTAKQSSSKEDAASSTDKKSSSDSTSRSEIIAMAKSRFTTSEIAYYTGLAKGGLTSEEKQEIKNAVYSKFTPEEIHELLSLAS